MTLGLIDIILAALIAYNLYNGKRWARVVFAFFIVLNILCTLSFIFKLDIGRTDYSKPSGNVTIVYSNGKAVRSWELGTVELEKMQKQEDARALLHRILMVESLVLLAVRAGYLYLLFLYHPVREFFYWQDSGV